jgi:hypothetical protein
MVWTKLISHTMLAAALAAGVLMFGAAPIARADDDVAECHRNVDKWEDRLHYDADRHGPESKQARHDRHELDEAKDHCRHRLGDRWHDNDEHHDYDRDRDNNRGY